MLNLLVGNSDNCVVDGPFRNLRPAYLTGQYEPHCLTREFNNGTEAVGRMLGENYMPEVIAQIHELSRYDEFRIKLESTPHGAIHSAVGGDMSPATSPNGRLGFAAMLRR